MNKYGESGSRNAEKRSFRDSGFVVSFKMASALLGRSYKVDMNEKYRR